MLAGAGSQAFSSRLSKDPEEGRKAPSNISKP